MPVEIVPLAIDAVKLVRTPRFGDARGHFSETWNRRAFAEAGLDVDFVQDNASLSCLPGTIRGLHFQTPPAEQAKLVRVTRGRIYDVAVDLRARSPTYGRFVGVELDAEDGAQLFVPVGFAHGFCTLEPNTEVAYKVSGFFSRAHDTGIAWDDPDVGIAWPLAEREPVLSEKDGKLPRLAEIAPPF